MKSVQLNKLSETQGSGESPGQGHGMVPKLQSCLGGQLTGAQWHKLMLRVIKVDIQGGESFNCPVATGLPRPHLINFGQLAAETGQTVTDIITPNLHNNSEHAYFWPNVMEVVTSNQKNFQVFSGH